MKIAVTGDLHLGITRTRTIKEFAAELAAVQPNVVGIVGDIADGGIAKIIQCLEIFKNQFPSIPIVACAGNHDLWVHDRVDSPELFRILGAEAHKLGIGWLDTENTYIDDVAIVGSYLHYDYSAKDTVGPCAGFSDAYYAKNKHNVNNDGNYMKGISDIEFANLIGAKFEERLDEATRRAGVSKIVVLSHVPCMECQLTRRPFNFPWSVGTPYFGNLSHQQSIKDNPKVVAVVSGHSHIGSDNLVERDNLAPIKVLNLSSEYYDPKAVVFDV